MGIIRADAGRTVRIAYQGENKRQQVAFPLADIMEEFPGGTAVLAILRKGDTDPVPAAITEMDGTDLIWTVTAWECAKDDFIYAQITYAVDEVVAKTKTYRFDVKGSLIVSAAEPETWQDMVGQLVTAAAALQAAIDAYDAMTAEAEGLAAGSAPTAEIDHTGDTPVLKLGIPAGANGYSPSASVSKVGKKATITITDQQGTTTAEISDGTDGADVIDDTAGSGDTGKTWSADKIVGELGDKYEKPAGGIPATDLASGVIPDPTSIIDDTAGAGATTKVVSADKHATDHSSLLNAIDSLPEQKNSTATGIDLDVSDEDGNVIVRMKDGGIQTKDFDSRYAAETRRSDASGSDFDLSDLSGNVLLRFSNGHLQTKNFNSGKYGARIITLKADGTGDYPNLKIALESITDADPINNPYEIHLKPGTYNTLAGYSDEEIRAADIGGGYTDQSMVGVKTKHGVSIIGDGDCSTVILTAELSTSDYTIAVRGNISTLNWKGTGRFENLTILAKNLRYCVHDDFTMDEQYERVVRNCVFRGTNLAYDPPSTYGAGIAYGGMIGLFENCDFGYDWGLHTRQLMKKDSVVELRNCTGNHIRIGDSSNDNDVAHHRYIINNCNFVRLHYSKSNGTTPHIHVIGCGNEKMMVTTPQGVVAKLGNIVKTKTANNLSVGTLVGIASGASYMSVADSVETAFGVIISKDNNYDYVQTSGFIESSKLGISGLSIGDYVTVDSNMEITTTGATASNAFGIVKYVDSNSNAYIWML